MTRYEIMDIDGRRSYVCSNCIEQEHNKCTVENCECQSCFDEFGEYE